MKYALHSFMRRATDLTRTGRLREAVAELQARFCVRPNFARSDEPTPGGDHFYAKDIHSVYVPAEKAQIPALPDWQELLQSSPAPIVEEIAADSRPASFTDGSFELNGKTHHYKIFVPGGTITGARPMVVMLHGCTQDPADFALGTDMNNIAGPAGWVVLYPAQSSFANHTKCWNWFKAGPEPGAGEPAWIATLTRRIQDEHRVDPDRTFIAGLSAGAAMAVLTAELHGSLFKGVGVHSGLAAHAAGNVLEAISVMKHGPSARQKRYHSSGTDASNPIIPVIVFHGDADKIVDPENADQIIEAAIAQAKRAEPGLIVSEMENKGAAAGTSYSQVIYAATANRPIAEYWRLHGAGHARSGGNDCGTHTDSSGPSASAEFLRFFGAVAPVSMDSVR